MSRFSIQGWCKTGTTQKSTPVEQIHFYLSDDDHLRLEQAEAHQQQSHAPEVMIDVDMATLDLRVPQD
jgi:hypothetical protein